ncbi:hypothetical protein PMAYCL1PPCAC_32723, partial [Pristionchus mayeri]
RAHKLLDRFIARFLHSPTVPIDSFQCRAMSKTVLITGANRGIGLGLVKEVLKHNSVGKLFATTRNVAKSDGLKGIADPRLTVVEMDADCDESVKKAAEQVAKTVGDAGVDVLVNNAGVLLGVDYSKPVKREDVAHNFNVNCIGTMVVTQAFRDLLKAAAKKNGHSQVVNISSILGSIALTEGSSPKLYTAYSMSKAAMNMFTRNVAIDWKADGIRCTSIHPGWVQTDMGGANATLTVEDSASNITDTMFKLDESNNGLFYNWKFEPIPW